MKKTFVVATNMTIATGDVGALMITTPAGTPVQLDDVIVSNSAGPVAVNLLEDYTYVEVAKSPLTPLAANRQLAPTSAVTIFAYPDISAVAGADALTVATMNLVAAMSDYRLGSVAIQLKPLTTYLLAFTNSNGGNAVVNFALSWKE